MLVGGLLHLDDVVGAGFVRVDAGCCHNLKGGAARLGGMLFKDTQGSRS